MDDRPGCGTAPALALPAGVTTRRRGAGLGLGLVLLVAMAGCFGGERGDITLGYAVETRLAQQPVTERVEGSVTAGREFFVRLQVPKPRAEAFVTLRAARRVGGSFQPLIEFDQPVSPPWRVVVIPLTLERRGEWLVSVFANSRKLTDAEVDVE